jgi:hypothetical protein
MTTQSFKDKQVMYELGDFFRSFGIGIYLRNIDGEEYLMTMDERVRDLLVSFTFKITDNGNKMAIKTFFINTPFLMVKMCDNLKMIFSDFKTDKIIADMTFYITSKEELLLDYVLLKFLVTHPAYLLLFTSLAPQFELDMSFIDDLLDRLWKMSPELTEEEEKRLNEYVKKFD